MDLIEYSSDGRKSHRPKRSLLTAIRAHCLEYIGGSSFEVANCAAPEFWLDSYRLGRMAVT